MKTGNGGNQCEVLRRQVMRYLEMRQRVAEEEDVKVGVYNGKAGIQSLDDHIRADVHLADEVCAEVDACLVSGHVVGVMVARQKLRQRRRVRQQLADPATNSDEQEVVDAVRS